MPGQPQLREAGTLYGDDPLVPLAMVRLEERMDGSGTWDIALNDPAEGPAQRAAFGTEKQARAELERIYEAGRVDGEWRVYRPNTNWP